MQTRSIFSPVACFYTTCIGNLTPHMFKNSEPLGTHVSHGMSVNAAPCVSVILTMREMSVILTQIDLLSVKLTHSRAAACTWPNLGTVTHPIPNPDTYVHTNAVSYSLPAAQENKNAL